MLDLTSLQKALDSMRRAIARSDAAADDEELRDAVIQRFGCSFELCWKMLKRRLEADAPSGATIDRLSYRELIREGAERGYVVDAAAWMRYREMRNLTAHTYDEDKAERVRTGASEFAADAAALLEALQSPNDA